MLSKFFDAVFVLAMADKLVRREHNPLALLAPVILVGLTARLVHDVGTQYSKADVIGKESKLTIWRWAFQ